MTKRSEHLDKADFHLKASAFADQNLTRRAEHATIAMANLLMAQSLERKT